MKLNKSSIVSLLLAAPIGAGVIADKGYGIEAAGNLAFVAIWLIILTLGLGLVVSNALKPRGMSVGTVVPFALLIVILIAAGWWVSWVVLLIMWVIARLSVYEAALEKSKSPENDDDEDVTYL